MISYRKIQEKYTQNLIITQNVRLIPKQDSKSEISTYTYYRQNEEHQIQREIKNKMITDIFYTKTSHNPLESSEEMILNWESNATSDLKPTVNHPRSSYVKSF